MTTNYESSDDEYENIPRVLRLACRHFDATVLRNLLQSNHCELRNGINSHCLVIAASNTNHLVMKALLDAGVSARFEPGLYWSSPCQVAASNENSLVLQLLIDAGADFRTEYARQGTPLRAAIRSANCRAVEILLSAGVDLGVTSYSGDTYVHEASSILNSRCLRLLIDAGANVNVANQFGVTPCHVAASNYDEAVLRMLIDAGANCVVADGRGKTPLHEAAQKNANVAVLSMLLAAGVQVDQWSTEDRTPIALACAYNNERVVGLLLAAGARMDQVDANGWSLCHYAAMNGNQHVMIALVMAGADINLQTNSGETACQIAAKYSHLALLVLIAAGADVDQGDHTGWTPLHQATPLASALLIAAGANASAKTTLVKTIAYEGGYDQYPIGTAPVVDLENLFASGKLALAHSEIERVGFDAMRKRAFEIACALQSMGLDALCLVEIVDAAVPFAARVAFHRKWNLVTCVKHFKQRERGLRLGRRHRAL